MSNAIESCGCESEPHQCVESDPAITMLQADLAARDAEIARLTAELAAARAVPPDVEAAIMSTVNGAEEAGRCAALGHAYPITKAPFWTVPRLKDTIARAISDATASKPATVGGLLATAPVGSIVEWKDGQWFRRCVVGRMVSSRWIDGTHRVWTGYAFLVDAEDLRLPARLVPAHLADADPATRGPIGEVPDVR